MSSRKRLDLTEERNLLLERMRFDVGVRTERPIQVENNLARAEVTTELRVVGSPYEPGLSGQLRILEGGEVILNEREHENGARRHHLHRRTRDPPVVRPAPQHGRR
ncbi:MAG: hypothetical protein R2712_19435 [Vicinamibacterales bacterium]